MEKKKIVKSNRSPFMFSFTVRILILAITLTLALSLFFSSTALAHRMLLDMPEKGVIRVKYDDGTVAGLARVVFYDEKGRILLEGDVEKDGSFIYNPEIAPYRVVADDNMGHRAVWEEGKVAGWDIFPRWQRALLGISIFLFIAAIAYFRQAGSKFS